MSKKTALKMSALAVAFAAAAAPITAAAEVTGSLGISNFYLWRGQDLTVGGGVVHGSVDYSHSSGLYAGVWGSSEASGIGGETDVYFGFAGEAGGLSYDISYWSYLYPSADVGYGEIGEVVLGLGMGDFGLGLYLSVADDASGDKAFAKDKYLTLSYDYDKFSFLVGTWMFDADDEDYTHFDISYSPVENLSFTVSKVISSDDFAGVTDDQDFLFNVGYSFSF
ncbi:MAG: TorF family putative porin [Alcanivoracaceae bacterium]